jgi:mono/diheme cytochrome c family protein
MKVKNTKLKFILLGIVLLGFIGVTKAAHSHCGHGGMGMCSDSSKEPSSKEANSLGEMPGEKLFQTKGCYTCHSIGQGDKMGPDLKGLFERRKEAWVKSFLSDPAKMSETDPIAIQLTQKFDTQMPNFSLSAAELNQLIEYLKQATK